MKNPLFHATPNKEYFRLRLMETSLYSVDFACASNHLSFHENVARMPELPTPSTCCRLSKYTILDGDATKFSCTDVTQT